MTSEARKIIMTTANKLFGQGQNRADAMRTAWQMYKNGVSEVVKGTTFENRQEALQHLTRYTKDMVSISLQKEENGAVAIVVTVLGKGSYKLGYIRKELAGVINPLLSKFTATFNGVCGGYEGLNYGGRIQLKIAA